MNDAHLHLLFNHLPILGAFLSIPALLIALWRVQERAALGIAVVLLALAAAGAGASLETGEDAEEVVEGLPGVSERLIHTHEERAELATGLSVVTALLGAGALAWGLKRGEGTPRAAIGAVLVANLVTAGAMAGVGASGGVIRHTEIRDGAAVSAEGGGPQGDQGGEDEGGEEQDGDDD